MSLPIVMVNDFYLEVARGNVTGFTSREVQGFNAAVAETEDVWGQGGTITQVSTAALLYVSSSAAADTAITVTVTGLDENYDEITEVFVTDGVSGRTRVTGTKAFLRVNNVELSAGGAGKIYVFYLSAVTNGVPDTASKIQATVAVGSLRSADAIYTVPRNKNLYLTSVRYQSAGSTTTHDVILTIIRKLYGGSEVSVKGVMYVDEGTTKFTDAQVQMTDQPVLFPAKSEIRVTADLAGGTALASIVMLYFIEEAITAVPATVDVMDKNAYLAYLAAGGPLTLASQNYWLIGLDEEPISYPLTVDLDSVLATITGATNYTVAADTSVTFDPAYFVDGKLVSTTKKAIVTIMRCVDSGAGIKYVLAPVNTVVNIRNVKKISYLHN